MSTAVFRVQEHILPTQHVREYVRATADGPDTAIHLVLKQYTPRQNLTPSTGDVTIIAAPGNSFPKELYGPLWDDLQQRSMNGKGFRIRGIWVADMSNQGESGVLNEANTGNEPSWDDHSRDLLHMINHFRDDMPVPIVGVGHSLGACQIVNLSIFHPGLFTSLVLLEPYIQFNETRATGHSIVMGSLNRRDVWPSRAAAAAAFKKGMKDWDPRVTERYIQHGLREAPTAVLPRETSASPPQVTLTTTRDQESLMMLRPGHEKPSKEQEELASKLVFRPEPVRVLSQLPLLRPSVLYMFGAISPISTPESRLEKLRLTGTGLGGSGGVEKGRVASVIVDGVGHLLPFQAIGRCADEVNDWLDKQLRIWRERNDEHSRNWNRLDKSVKMAIDKNLKAEVKKEDWSPGDPHRVERAKNILLGSKL